MEKRTVLTLLKNAAKNYKNTYYTCDKGDTGYIGKTFEEVRNDAICFAAELRKHNFNKADKIAILSEGRASWITAEHGILMAGCISIPLSTQLLPEEILFRINHSEAKAIIVSRNSFEKVASIWKRVDRKDFKIIYLEDNISIFEDNAKKFGLNTNKDVLIFNRMITESNKNFKEVKQKIEDFNETIAEHDVVSICYTSGTTGNPKGIMLTHLNYYSNSTEAVEFFNVKEKDRLFIVLPLDHSFAHTVGTYASLSKGLTLYFVDARGGSVAALKNMPINMKEANPHFMLTVPTITGKFMNKIIDSINEKGGVAKKLFDRGLEAGIAINGDGYHKGSLITRLTNMATYKLADTIVFSKIRKVFGQNMRYCVGGGALLDIKQQKFFYAIGIPVYQGYGLTEATPIISANTPNMHKLGTSGKVLPTIQCKIIKADGTKAKKGERGEIVIQGENVMKGYFKNKEATEKTLKGGWLFTGDIGYYDEDGFLMVIGREKALLIAPDGEKYSPEGIEEAIMNTSDLVAQVMLYNDHKKYTVALITLDENRIENLVKRKKIANSELLLKEIKKSFYRFKEDAEYANKYSEKWLPTGFRIVDEPFSEKNKMINSTLKMVRHKITEVYKDLIDDMYEASGDKIVNAHNLEVVKKYLPFT